MAIKVPESRDYATEVLRDPWDMSNKEDMSELVKNFRNPRMSGGTWRATTGSEDAYFFFLWGGYPGSYATGRDGMANPVNAGLYKRLSFRMYLGLNDTSYRRGTFYWFYDMKFKSKGQMLFKVYPGWHTYQIDLPANWSGRPIALRLDPIDKAGVPVEIDWIRLTNRASSAINLEWLASVAGNATFYLSNGLSYDGSSLGSVDIESGYGSTSLDLDGLYPGTYYIYVYHNGENSNFSPGATVNEAPRIDVIEPDEMGGRDWARSALRNPWDMRSGKDISTTYNVARSKFRRGVFSGINAKKSSNGARKHDPYLILNLGGKTINSNKYHLLTFRYKYSRSFTLKRGTMSRFGWITKRYNDPKFWQITDDLVTYEGWNTITFDLKKIKLNRGSYGWKNRITSFRFDPHEDRNTRKFYVDDISLREYDKVGPSGFLIKYGVEDANDSSVNINIYADKDKSFGNGNETLITSEVKGNGRHSYRWRPSKGARGLFWIYIQANDGVNESGYYSTGPVER